MWFHYKCNSMTLFQKIMLASFKNQWALIFGMKQLDVKNPKPNAFITVAVAAHYFWFDFIGKPNIIETTE